MDPAKFVPALFGKVDRLVGFEHVAIQVRRGRYFGTDIKCPDSGEGMVGVSKSRLLRTCFQIFPVTPKIEN